MVLLSAWQLVLSRWSGQDDLVVGTPTAGRTHAQAEGLLGFFVNTLALRGDLRGLKTFRNFLQRVRETTLGAYAHQELPFERLVEALCPVRDLSRQPLFQVMFGLQNAGAVVAARFQQSDQDTGLQLEWVELGQPHAKFDLTLNVEEPQGTGGLQATLEFASDLFERSTIERLCGHMLNVLGAIVADPDQDLSQISMLSEAERHQQLHEWNAPQQVISDDTFVSRFQAQVLRTGDAIAVDYLGQQLTYAQLEVRAQRLARHLQARGLRREEIVGIHAERGAHLLPGLVGILEAGGVFLPIDPAYPPARQQYMLRDAGVRWLLTDCGGAPGVGAVCPLEL
ncbi:MAG TPA: condensation domain-containing protein, partial [Polyangiaceae bacterium]|nr:condensation domain-containing protein [Polyangiaceae bacterium]